MKVILLLYAVVWLDPPLNLNFFCPLFRRKVRQVKSFKQVLVTLLSLKLYFYVFIRISIFGKVNTLKIPPNYC